MGPGPAQGEGRGRGAPAPPPRLSHASSPRARAVAPEPAPPERLRAPGVSLRPPQHNHPGNGGPPAPLAGGPRALLASGAASAARFYLRSDFDAKNRAGARASLGGWARARARVTCHWVCVCVCVPVCVLGTGAPVPCAPPSPGCPGLDSTQGTWPAATAPGRPLGGALGQGPGRRSPCRCRGGVLRPASGATTQCPHRQVLATPCCWGLWVRLSAPLLARLGEVQCLGHQDPGRNLGAPHKTQGEEGLWEPLLLLLLESSVTAEGPGARAPLRRAPPAQAPVPAPQAVLLLFFSLDFSFFFFFFFFSLAHTNSACILHPVKFQFLRGLCPVAWGPRLNSGKRKKKL